MPARVKRITPDAGDLTRQSQALPKTRENRPARFRVMRLTLERDAELEDARLAGFSANR